MSTDATAEAEENSPLSASPLQAHIGAMFMVAYMIIFSAITSLELFIQERALFVHEKTSGFYRTSAYFLAKVVCEILPTRMVPTLFYAVVTAYMAGLRTDFYHLSLYWLTLTGRHSLQGVQESNPARTCSLGRMFATLTHAFLVGLLHSLSTQSQALRPPLSAFWSRAPPPCTRPPLWDAGLSTSSSCWPRASFCRRIRSLSTWRPSSTSAFTGEFSGKKSHVKVMIVVCH